MKNPSQINKVSPKKTELLRALEATESRQTANSGKLQPSIGYSLQVRDAGESKGAPILDSNIIRAQKKLSYPPSSST